MTTLPTNYQWLLQQFPKVMETHQQLGQVLAEAGPLDEKTGHLVRLAAAAANRSEGAVHSHTKRAMAAGASADEVYHALISLVSAIGFPAVAAALSWARESIGQ